MTRIEQLQGGSTTREGGFVIQWEGREIQAYPGETVLGALIASGIHTLRHTDRFGEPRGMLCGMGICFECLVSIDGVEGFRACVTPAKPGMIVKPHSLPAGLTTGMGIDG